MENKAKKPTNPPKGEKKPTTTGSGLLRGRCFHVVDNNERVTWQGEVIGSPEPGWYLVVLFSWLDGLPSSERLVRIEDMQGWVFYWDSDQMKYSGDYGEMSGREPFTSMQKDDKDDDI